MRRLMLVALMMGLIAGSASAAILPLVNGGFEAGVPYPWSSAGFTGWENVNTKAGICLDGGTEGAKYFLADAAGGTAQFIQRTSYVIQSGYTYTLSCDAKSLGSNQFIIAICATDGDGAVVAQPAGQAYNASTTPIWENGVSWQNYAVSFTDDGTLAGNTLMVYFAIQGTGIPSGAYGCVDNVQLNAVPEPMTMSLLGLGGLVCLYRRRW